MSLSGWGALWVTLAASFLRAVHWSALHSCNTFGLIKDSLKKLRIDIEELFITHNATLSLSDITELSDCMQLPPEPQKTL